MKIRVLRLFPTICLTSMLAITIGFTSIAYAVGDYHLSFWVGGLQINLQHPEECHTGDTINYKINIYSSGANHIVEFNVSIRCWKYGTQPYLDVLILYQETLYENVEMPFHNEYTITIPVTIPKENIATGYAAWIVFDIWTYRSGHPEESAWTNLVLDTTKIVWKTWQELYNENGGLRSNYSYLEMDYTWLNQSYEWYKQTHNHSNSEYDTLNSTYNQYKQTHSHTDTEYNDITSDLGGARNLSYVFIITTIVFIATTLLFAIRKPRAKPEAT